MRARLAIYAARPPRTMWLEECYDWHTCTRYHKRTLWHSLTTACIATDANIVSSVSPRPSARDHDSSKSTSLTVCVQPPVNSFRAILNAVQQSHEISRARARERERRCCPLTKVVESCCVAQHGSQALVSTTVSLHNSRPSAASTSRYCGMALCHVATRVAPTKARAHTRVRAHGILHLRSQTRGFLSFATLVPHRGRGLTLSSGASKTSVSVLHYFAPCEVGSIYLRLEE